ncbi:unnamed protein product [Caenorhabditis nigoni]
MAETIKESSEVIKKNTHSLKTCILYEARKEKPIFSSYRNFCKLIGQDAMEFKEFEFWYYRFYNGQTDFNYDRSMDPVPKNIMDMPVKLMYKITENLDTVERTYLRTMNKSIKDIADSFEPIFDNVEIEASYDCLKWKLNDKMFRCSKEANGCILFTPNKKIKSDESFLKKGMEYLTPLFQIPKVKTNHLSLYDRNQALDDLLSVPFHAKSVKLNVSDNDQTFQFLSAMNPGELESIILKAPRSRERDQILRFFETEQFIQAKHVQLEAGLNVNDLLKFSHLKSFKCKLTTQQQADFQRVREIISSFVVLESCELTVGGGLGRFPVRTIGEALGEEIPFGPLKIITHRYPIPESNEQLEFEIENDESSCFIKIVKIR